MKRFIVVALAYTAVVLVIGLAIGAVVAYPVYKRIDPLRQEPAAMTAWLAANQSGDWETMWKNTNADFQKQYGGHDGFIAEFSHPKADNPPPITFLASVPMPTGGWEVFYSLDFGKSGPAVISMYVDQAGKFEMFTT